LGGFQKVLTFLMGMHADPDTPQISKRVCTEPLAAARLFKLQSLVLDKLDVKDSIIRF
jgi:hypothetical protein